MSRIAGLEQLARLFRVIVPDKRNLKVYGYEIRDLLLACTEKWKPTGAASSLQIITANRTGGSPEKTMSKSQSH